MKSGLALSRQIAAGGLDVHLVAVLEDPARCGQGFVDALPGDLLGAAGTGRSHGL